ncbi:MAG: Ppx/GppA phosphatase family protein [Hyphomicrobiales bacterium]
MANFDGEDSGSSGAGSSDADTSKNQEGAKRKRRRRGRRGKRGQSNAAQAQSTNQAPHQENTAHPNPQSVPSLNTDSEGGDQSVQPSMGKPQAGDVQNGQRAGNKRRRKPWGNRKPRENQADGMQPRSSPSQTPSTKPRPQHDRSTNFRDRPAYAALDLGTNNCRLLVAVPNGSAFRVVDAFSRIVRLGEGIAHTGRLSDEAMDRAVDALKVCASKLNNRNIKRFRLIATEACRVAENGETFIKRVREEAGLELEIVDRETEARLAVAGCSSLVDRSADGAILFDIGGGSSELVWLDLKSGKRRRGELSKLIRTWTSLPVGVVNISERHGGVRVTPESFEGMVNEVIGMLDDFPEGEALSHMVSEGRVHMLGTSGTVTTLAGVHLGLEYYDRRKVDGIWMSSDEVSSMTQRLLDMSFEEREQNACIGKDRADLVLAGCAILEALRRKWPCSRLRVADRGLREGILYELMNKDGVLRTSQRPRNGGGRKPHHRHRPRGNKQ